MSEGMVINHDEYAEAADSVQHKTYLLFPLHCA